MTDRSSHSPREVHGPAAWVDRLVHPDVRASGGPALRRLRLTVVAAAVALAFLLAGTLRFAWLGLHGGLEICAAATALTAGLLCGVRFARRPGPVGNALAGTVLLALVGLVAGSGGRMTGALYMLALVPMQATLLVGPRSGAAWCVITLAAIAACHATGALPLPFPVEVDSARVEAERWVGAYLFTLGVATIGALFDRATRLASRDELRASERADRVHRELQESEARYRDLVERAPLGVLACDASGRIAMANARALELLDLCDAEDPTSLDIATRPALCEAGVPDLFAHCVREATPLRREVRLSAKGDELPREVRLRLSPISNDAGRVSGVHAIVEDVTAENRAGREHAEFNERLRHTQRLESLGVLAGGIAHDFNNLLTSILGNAELAELELGEDSPVTDLVREVQGAALHATHLTRQMLAYAGKATAAVEQIDLSELVDDMTPLLGAAVAARACLHYELETDLPKVEADPAQLRQIVLNLVTNASDALGGERGEVRLATSACGAEALRSADTVLLPRELAAAYVRLEVSDSGTGMDADTRERIFEPFYSTKRAGRGLGLSAMLGSVRGHDGGLQVKSAPGEGTRFRVHLPVAAAAPEPAPAAPTSQGDAVLIVDDEKGIRRAASRILRRAGYEVLTASTGREGLEIFEERHADVATCVVDLTMPGIDGAETLRAMRRIDPTVRAVLSTGYGDARESRELAREGVQLLEKPYDRARLLAAVSGEKE